MIANASNGPTTIDHAAGNGRHVVGHPTAEPSEAALGLTFAVPPVGGRAALLPPAQ